AAAIDDNGRMTTPEIRVLDAAFGAEVVGFEPGALLDDETRAVLTKTFDDRGVLVFRGREVPLDVQVQLANLLAGTDGNAHGASLDDTSSVSNVREDGATPFGRLPFHSDGMWSEQPYLALSLYATEIESPAVPTRFASTATGWATLPAELRSRV